MTRAMNDTAQSILERALSTTSDAEALACLRQLRKRDWSPQSFKTPYNPNPKPHIDPSRNFIYTAEHINAVREQWAKRVEILNAEYQQTHKFWVKAINDRDKYWKLCMWLLFALIATNTVSIFL